MANLLPRTSQQHCHDSSPSPQPSLRRTVHYFDLCNLVPKDHEQQTMAEVAVKKVKAKLKPACSAADSEASSVETFYQGLAIGSREQRQKMAEAGLMVVSLKERGNDSGSKHADIAMSAPIIVGCSAVAIKNISWFSNSETTNSFGVQRPHCHSASIWLHQTTISKSLQSWQFYQL
jgi:hypothetical protein